MSLVYYVYYGHSGDVTPLRLTALYRIIGRPTRPVFRGQRTVPSAAEEGMGEGRMNSAAEEN